LKRETADLICRGLLAIVAALRKEYHLPDYRNITIECRDNVIGYGYLEPTVTDGQPSDLRIETPS
jgi:hypothetical protein